MSAAETIIGEVRKNAEEVIRVAVGEFKGKLYCHVRTWMHEEGTPGPGKPTVKGLTLRPDILLELLPLLSRAQERASEGCGR